MKNPSRSVHLFLLLLDLSQRNQVNYMLLQLHTKKRHEYFQHLIDVLAIRLDMCLGQFLIQSIFDVFCLQVASNKPLNGRMHYKDGPSIIAGLGVATARFN
jgi:hypothetical protein